MTDWTSGYVADIAYTFGYYAELHPLRLQFAFLNAGLVAGGIRNACELGYGQGLSTNIHAAASNVRWWGTDFNPSQAAFAQELAEVSGSGAQLFDQSFEEFCSRPDLPEFEFIALHGIWSWISEENRHVIVDFVRRKLKVGGVLYVSYNTLPGWAPMLPMRHLLTRHASLMGATGEGILRRVDGALDFAGNLLKLNPLYSRAQPELANRVQKLKDQNRHYVAHEYFNRDWHPIHFLEMADLLAPAKLAFACSANYLDHVDAVNMTPEQQEFLKAQPDPMFREAVRDFVVNQQFRRDYWVRGARKSTGIDRLEAIRRQRFMLVTPAEFVGLTVAAPLGEATLNAEVYKPVLAALADQQPHTVAQLEGVVGAQKVPMPQLLQALMILVAKGDVCAVQDDAVAARARPQCERLNRHLMAHARSAGEVGFLASPLLGGGFPVSRFEQLFLHERQKGVQGADAIAANVWQLFKAQGQQLLRDGAPIPNDEGSVAYLLEQAKRFVEHRLPTLRAVQIV